MKKEEFDKQHVSLKNINEIHVLYVTIKICRWKYRYKIRN